MNQQKKRQFDIMYIKEQIKFCELGIVNGDYTGYTQALEYRKERLKRLNKQLKNLLT